MKRISFAIAVALAAVSSPVAAQPAAALGHPLPAPDYDVGEISVRVIAGSVASPVIGVEVTLLVDGTPRIARTDSGGRAIFKDLAAGTPVQAVIKDADGKDVQSDTFPMPDSGGVHVMLTTRPMDPSAMGGGAPFAGGGAAGGGMPDPRKISGVPRAEQKNPAGTLSVRVTYSDMKDKVPNIPVTLVSYGADGNIGVVVKQTDPNGRALFDGLDISSSTAYYAMAQVPRNGTLDRLVSTPIIFGPQVGVALMLSSEKVDSTAPMIDDQSHLDTQDAAVPPGKVIVLLDGEINAANQVNLLDVVTHAVVAHAVPELGPPDITNVRAGANYEPRPDEAPGTIDVTLHGGAGSTDKPLAGLTVKLFAADDRELKSPTPGITNASGVAHFDVKPGVYRAQLVVNTKELGSQPLDVTAGGATLSVNTQWPAVGEPRGVLDVTPTPGQTLYAETRSRSGVSYRSAPFQLVADHGTMTSIRAVPPLFSFHIITSVEDQLLAVEGQFTIMNFSWAPYKAGPDGLDIPLPRGFKGAQIEQRDQSVASVAAGIGFRIPRPLPPAGPTVFHGGWSLPVNGGTAEWSQDLPLGTVESWIRMIPQPGMTVEVPKGAQGGMIDTDDGPLYAIPRITIAANHSMVLAVHGLPSPPAWKVWLPRIIGLLVVGVILVGVVLAVARPGSGRAAADPGREARRTRLLEELVELERTGKDAKRRESLLVELEKLWDDAAA